MKRRESGRILGVLVALVLIAGVGVGAWYFLVYTKSPQYALNQFFTAAKANDKEKVSQLTDPSGPLMLLLAQQLDPASAIYPGYGQSTAGSTESVQVGEVTVEGDTAKAKVTMVVNMASGEKMTINPTYVLRKVEGNWKVAIEPTFAGSFNEFVPPAIQRAQIQQLRRIVSQPGVGAMVKGQLEAMRPQIEQYPQLAEFLRKAGLL